MKEVELAEKVVAYLEDAGWDVYQEVAIGDRVADIVAVMQWRDKAKLVHVIECKTSLSLAVMSQAWYWLIHANYCSVAVPKRRYTNASSFAEMVCRNSGIGVIRVEDWRIDYDVAPWLRRKRSPRLLPVLRQEHKVYAKAGTNGGGHYTPFKKTCLNILEAVNQNPGIQLKELIDQADHHYANDTTAKSCVRYWVEAGKVAGVRVEKDGKSLRYYPIKEETQQS